MSSNSVPTHHKAVVYDKPGELSTKIVTLDTPKGRSGEVSEIFLFACLIFGGACDGTRN